MKNLLASTLAFSLVLAAAHADTLEQPNQAGGKIVLTTRACDKPDATLLLEAYTYEASGAMRAGCWVMLDGLIHIVWQGGGRSVFPFASFSRPPSPAPIKPSTRGS